MDDQLDAKGVPPVDSKGDSVDAKGSGPAAKMPASQFSADCYNMDHEGRGFCIIFNNRKFDPGTGMGERSGTDIDAQELYMIFSEMGFEVEIKQDLTKQEMKTMFQKVGRIDHSKMDCFACAILSHGQEGYVYGKDGPIQIDELVAPLKGDKCLTLAGKPKLFFIQACRGDKLDHGVEVADAKGVMPEDEVEVDIRRIPTEADFLMAYSVVPGFFAWRNSTRGSWFCQALVKVLRENWKRMDLLSMMTRVSRIVAFDFESNASREFMNCKKQIPCVTSMLTRDVYFTPKK